MSERNYKPGLPHLPLGKYRREVPVPNSPPKLDTTGVFNVLEWRNLVYRKPFLDDLNGHYYFEAATEAGAKAYTGARKFPGAFTRELIRDYLAKPDTVDPRLRQVIHRAESTEKAIAVFARIAIARGDVLHTAIDYVGQQASAKIDDGNVQQLPREVATYAADAIVDFGLCLEQPYEKTRPGIRYKPSVHGGLALRARLDQIAPGVGTSLANFGSYAGAHPETLVSYDGLLAMNWAADEQEYRSIEWMPRYSAVAEAFPALADTKKILYDMPLHEIFVVQGHSAA